MQYLSWFWTWSHSSGFFLTASLSLSPDDRCLSRPKWGAGNPWETLDRPALHHLTATPETPTQVRLIETPCLIVGNVFTSSQRKHTPIYFGSVRAISKRSQELRNNELAEVMPWQSSEVKSWMNQQPRLRAAKKIQFSDRFCIFERKNIFWILRVSPLPFPDKRWRPNSSYIGLHWSELFYSCEGPPHCSAWSLFFSFYTFYSPILFFSPRP